MSFISHNRFVCEISGYEVVGTFMRNWNESDENVQCAADKDLEDAKFTCDRLGIPLKEVNFVKEYWNNVFQWVSYGSNEIVDESPPRCTVFRCVSFRMILQRNGKRLR